MILHLQPKVRKNLITPPAYEIYRPLLGYPALVYTGLNNAYPLLKADIATALTREKRASAFRS